MARCERRQNGWRWTVAALGLTCVALARADIEIINEPPVDDDGAVAAQQDVQAPDEDGPADDGMVVPVPDTPTSGPVAAPAAADRTGAAAAGASAPATRPADDPVEQLPTTRPATPARVPDGPALAAARRKIWQQFHDAYDRPSAESRAALGHQLLRLALRSDADDMARYALLREVRDLATDVADEPLAMKSAKAVGVYFDVDPVEERWQTLSARAWPQDEPQQARGLFDDWSSLATDAESAGRFELAARAAERALGVARHWGDEGWVAAASALTARLDVRRAEGERLEAARKTLLSHPADPNANLVVGCHEAAAGHWDAALPMLGRSADPVVGSAARADLKTPTKADARVNAGDAWLAAAEGRPDAVAQCFRARARHWYEAALPGLSATDQAEVKRRLKGLPGGTIFDTIAEAAGSPRRAGPVGGPGGGSFDETTGQPALLVGFRITVGEVFAHPCITSAQPIFRSASGRLTGATHGKGTEHAETVEARDGYAVGGVVLKTGQAVDGFKVVFMRIRGAALDPADRYESAWLGGRGGGSETPLGCDGHPVIGIAGRCGDGLDALGLLQSP